MRESKCTSTSNPSQTLISPVVLFASTLNNFCAKCPLTLLFLNARTPEVRAQEPSREVERMKGCEGEAAMDCGRRDVSMAFGTSIFLCAMSTEQGKEGKTNENRPSMRHNPLASSNLARAEVEELDAVVLIRDDGASGVRREGDGVAGSCVGWILV
jgi:hypothetical protein